MKNLQIKGFLYIVSIPVKNIGYELRKYLPQLAAIETAEKIKNQSQKYVDTLASLGIGVY